MSTPPLSELTTLAVGGPAPALLRPTTLSELKMAIVRLAADFPGLAPLVVGGGSNLLVADAGPGRPVLMPAITGVRVLDETPEAVHLRVGAGVVWDDLVAHAVHEGWAGIECLSGIPGWVGAAPVQNIGAYGQEVEQVIVAVHAIELASGSERVFPAESCGFHYRDSVFKSELAGRYVIHAVDLRLVPGGAPTLAYPELQRAAEALGEVTLSTVRQTVLSLRAGKSMVYDEADPNHRSAGSFFTNPILDDAHADEVVRKANILGHARVPRFPCGPGRSKLSAAWLIERSGFGKGHGSGQAGLSSKHCLAIINRGAARADDIVSLALEIHAGVLDTFGVELVPEPVFVGFRETWGERVRNA